MELDDVRVRQTPHDGDLALDVVDEGRVREEFLLVEDFDGDALARAAVTRVVDFGECAASEELPELVFPEQGVAVVVVAEVVRDKLDLRHGFRRRKLI